MIDPRARLQEIIDRLGPNMWLELDCVSFPWFFECQLDSSEPQRRAGIEVAKAFAQDIGAAFKFDEETLKVRFGRACFKDVRQ